MLTKLWGGPCDGQWVSSSQDFVEFGEGTVLYKKELVRYRDGQEIHKVYLYYDEIDIQRGRVKRWLDSNVPANL